MKSRVDAVVARALVAVMAIVLFAMAGSAQAAMIHGAGHKSKAGKLEITAPTEVGGTLLPPGEYEVKVRKAGSGLVVEFARWNYNPYAQETLPVWDREVVATVNASAQEMASVATRTGLLLAADSNRAVAMQIRGESVEYGF